ncbi:MAG: ABC transporter ATP-binding protein [Eubacterium sp.]|jgi:ABC-type multidrug transport system fused ATPase/permease subunit|nr:ABC transporter ATP-binding protein [Eubacterium sp.]
MWKLLVYLKDYKKESVLGPLFKLLEASFELMVPLVMASIIDKGIGGGDTGYVFGMGGVLLLLAAVGLASSLTAQYFAAKAAVGFSTKMKSALFRHIETLSYAEIDRLGSTSLITRMTSDANQVQSGVNLVLRLFLRSPFIVLGAMIMAFTIDVKAAMIFVVAIPLLSIVVFGVMFASIPLYRKVQTGLDRVLGITRENLTGARVIRAFGKEEEEIDTFEEANVALNRVQMFVGRISALMNPLTYIIINGATVVLIWTGAVRVDTGLITQGAVVALVNYMSQILVELVKLANLIITVTKAIACGNRIQDVFEVETSLPDEVSEQVFLEKKKEQATPAVVFDHVGFTYQQSSEEAISDITFTAKKGEVIGVIGGTGSGKTSLVNLIPRFYDITSGKLSVDGLDVRQYPLARLRGKIGVVPQKAVLFYGTIRSNMQWGRPDATDEDIWEALVTAQAADFVRAKEGGLDALVEQGGKNFSGGQRQRLTIARALVKKPDILILDDSASALDYATDAALRKGIRENLRGTTLFIVSQRTSSLLQSDRIIVLDDGGVVGIGTHDELLAGCEVYREIYESQFGKGGVSK